jgi:hypothetical protein
VMAPFPALSLCTETVADGLRTSSRKPDARNAREVFGFRSGDLVLRSIGGGGKDEKKENKD